LIAIDPDGRYDRRGETPDATCPEANEVRWAAVDVRQEDPGDEESAEDEEDVDTQKTSTCSREPEVECHDSRDGDTRSPSSASFR
jgi:hypothetical protein